MFMVYVKWNQLGSTFGLADNQKRYSLAVYGFMGEILGVCLIFMYDWLVLLFITIKQCKVYICINNGWCVFDVR